MLNELCEYDGDGGKRRLNDWEVNFVADLSAKVADWEVRDGDDRTDYPMSGRQQGKIVEIYEAIFG